MNPLHLFWIIPLAAALGFQGGSIVEYRKKINFAGLELNDIRTLITHVKQLVHMGASDAAKA